MMGFYNFSVVTIRARVEGVILNMHNVNVFTIFFYGGHPSHINLNETDSFLASFYVPSLKKIYVYILDKRRVKRTVENFTQGDSDRQFLT